MASIGLIDSHFLGSLDQTGWPCFIDTYNRAQSLVLGEDSSSFQRTVTSANQANVCMCALQLRDERRLIVERAFYRYFARHTLDDAAGQAYIERRRIDPLCGH